MGDELAKSPSASRLERHALLTLGDDDGARGGPPALRRSRSAAAASARSRTGQIMYLERHGLIDERTRFFGCSLGAYFAVGYALSGREKRPGALRERFVAATLDFVADVHFDWLGMWGLCGVVFEDILRANLPDDAAARARGVAHVGVTRFGLPWPPGAARARRARERLPRQRRPRLRAHRVAVHPRVDARAVVRARALPRRARVRRRPVRQPALPPSTATRATAVRFDERLRPPALDEPRGHYMCREEHAPLAQVFRPPPCAFGRVEERLVDELRAATAPRRRPCARRGCAGRRRAAARVRSRGPAAPAAPDSRVAE